MKNQFMHEFIYIDKMRFKMLKTKHNGMFSMHCLKPCGLYLTQWEKMLFLTFVVKLQWRDMNVTASQITGNSTVCSSFS